jgi:CHAT domain-containing protein
MLAVGLDEHDGGSGPAADLHHAEAEARAVAALWPTERVDLRVGTDASWSELLTAGLTRTSVLHLATHAVVHRGASERASLRLAGNTGGQPVTLRSLAALDLEADLIYLSCCEGAKSSRPGAGLTGFARAFLAAGARTVVASTIRVDDEASRELATRFYDHWLQGESKAAALRAAQLELRDARPAWRHPYYWSFYRIIGEAD